MDDSIFGTKVSVEREIAGRVFRLTTGEIAKQASGAVFLQHGETVLFAAAQIGPPRPGIDFFPLQVDYRERLAAAGRFAGGFLKREGRPTTREILTARVTDLVSVGAAGYNLWGAESVDLPRAVGGGVLARPLPSLAVSFDARWKLDGDDHPARYGGGAELFLRPGNGQTGFPIRAGALRDNGLDATYLSAGLGYATMKLAVDVAARFAVSGADATMFIASLRFYGPRLQSPALGVVE